ncbi:MAG: agmatinase [Methanosarcinales archaeon]|nr:agmatinase [Methanosarcinales archaeon]
MIDAHLHRGIAFADAVAGYDDASFVIYGAPFDATSSFRTGSKWAPAAIRKESYNHENYSHHFDFSISEELVCDAGDLDLPVNVDTALDIVGRLSKKLYSDDKFPIMLGGEHSLTVPCVRAAKERYGDDLGVIVLDAHHDLRSEYNGQVFSHACTSYHLTEMMGKKFVSLGIRSGDRENYEYASDNGIMYFSADDIYETGIGMVIDKIRTYLNCKYIYISLDMDAIDPAYAPGLGTPEPFGLTPWQVRKVLREFASDCIGFDVMEILPEFDFGQTAALGAVLVRDFIAASSS